MLVFVDTSALFAVLDDDKHPTARRLWPALLDHHDDLICSSYVLVEAFALLQRRLWIEAARALQSELQVTCVDESLHVAGVAALLTAGN